MSVHQVVLLANNVQIGIIERHSLSQLVNISYFQFLRVFL